MENKVLIESILSKLDVVDNIRVLKNILALVDRHYEVIMVSYEKRKVP